MRKDSGNGFHHTELGVLPVDWKIRSVRELQLDISDGNYSSKYPRADEFKSIGVPFIRANNIKGLTITDDDMRFISEKKHSEITKGHLKDGDVLITNRGDIGNLAIVPARHIGSNINAQIVRINTSGSEVSNRYFAYYLQKDEVKKLLDDLSSGSALKQLPVNRLTTLKVIIPSPQEQTAIANALSDVDALISEQEKLIAKKQAIKTATMQQLLTGRTRLPQFAMREDGTPKGTKPSELGEIPEDWEVFTFADVISFLSSGATPYRGNKSFYKGTIRWITSGELNYCVINDTIEKISDEAVLKTNLKIHPAGTFLMAITGLEAAGTRGACGIVGQPSATNQSCMAIYPNDNLMTQYLYFWYVYNGEELAFKYCQGTKQLSYTAGLIKKIPIYLPCDTGEQTAIATILSDMDAEIQALEQRLGKTRQIKQGMMQELLTGKTRLIKPSKEVIHE